MQKSRIQSDGELRSGRSLKKNSSNVASLGKVGHGAVYFMDPLYMDTIIEEEQGKEYGHPSLLQGPVLEIEPTHLVHEPALHTTNRSPQLPGCESKGMKTPKSWWTDSLRRGKQGRGRRDETRVPAGKTTDCNI